jgi:hypothetical protein
MPLKTLLTLLLLAGISPLPGVAQASSQPPPVKNEKAATTAHDYSKEAFVIERYSTRISAEADGTPPRGYCTPSEIDCHDHGL